MAPQGRQIKGSYSNTGTSEDSINASGEHIIESGITRDVASVFVVGHEFHDNLSPSIHLILKNPFFFYFSGVLGSGNLIWGGGGGGDESDFQDLHVE